MTVHVPDELEELLTPEWLTAALAPRYPGIRVTAVEIGQVIRRVSIVAFFQIECEGGVPEGLSTNLVAKGYFGEHLRQVRYVGEAEAFFYREIVEPAGLRSMRCVYADIDPESRHGVVITEDAGVAGGTFLSALSEYRPDTVAESLEQYARLHAATWSNPRYANESALAPRFVGLSDRFDARFLDVNVLGPLGDAIPSEARDPDRLASAYRTVVARAATATPWVVLHGDAHVGNILLDADGRPVLVDWQLVQRGGWYMDVGYHLGSSLPVEERRTHEDELLRHYLSCLAGHGIDAPSFETARSLIGLGLIHGMFLWSITRQVDSAVIKTLLGRLGAAVADHRAFDTAESSG